MEDMQYLIVFSSKKEMEKFENRGYTLPDGLVVDCLENGKLSILSKNDDWSAGKTRMYPDVIQGDFSAFPLKIFLAMPEWWRQDYERDYGDGDVWGNWIGELKKGMSKEAIEELSTAIEECYEGWGEKPDKLFFKWPPPSTMPRAAQNIVESPKQAPEPLIDGMVNPRESLLITAAAGAGKSLIVNYLTNASASVENLWGIFPVKKPLKSLIVQAEVSDYAVKNRLEKLIKANPTFKRDGVYFLSDSFSSDVQILGKLSDSEFQKRILAAIEDIDGVDLLWMDPLIAFNPVDENNNTAMRKVLDDFEAVIRPTGASIVFTHHVGKTGKGSRGASAITDWAANILELEEDRQENGEARIKVSTPKLRNFPKFDPFYLTRTKDLSFELAESKATRQEDERLKCVVDALEKVGGRIEGQGKLVDQIIKMKNAPKRRTAVDRIKDARDLGLILEFDSGTGNSKVYLLPKK